MKDCIRGTIWWVICFFLFCFIIPLIIAIYCQFQVVLGNLQNYQSKLQLKIQELIIEYNNNIQLNKGYKIKLNITSKMRRPNLEFTVQYDANNNISVQKMEQMNQMSQKFLQIFKILQISEFFECLF